VLNTHISKHACDFFDFIKLLWSQKSWKVKGHLARPHVLESPARHSSFLVDFLYFFYFRSPPYKVKKSKKSEILLTFCWLAMAWPYPKWQQFCWHLTEQCQPKCRAKNQDSNNLVLDALSVFAASSSIGQVMYKTTCEYVVLFLILCKWSCNEPKSCARVQNFLCHLLHELHDAYIIN
jgi:hypothetical protein